MGAMNRSFSQQIRALPVVIALAPLLGLLTAACATLPTAHIALPSALTAGTTAKAESSAPPPSTVAGDLHFATVQYYSGNYDTSAFYLKRVLMKAPDHADALRLLPWTYFFQKRFDRSLAAFTRAETAFPRNPLPPIGKGWSYFALGLYSQALENFDRAEHLGGSDYEIHKGRGFAQLKMHRLDAARKEFDKIYSPQDIGKILKQWATWNGDHAGPFPHVVSTDPEAPSLFHLPVEHPRYPSLLLALPPAPDVIAEAPKEDYSTPPNGPEPLNLYRVNPPLSVRPPPTLDNAWDLYYKGFYEMALAMFEKLPPHQAQSFDGRNGFAWALLRYGEFHAAETQFKDLLKKYPGFIAANEGLQTAAAEKIQRAAYAQQYLDMNKLRIAANQIHTLMKQYPSWPHGHAQLGWIELKNANYPAARADFRKALQLDSDYEPALKGLFEVRKASVPDLAAAEEAFAAKDYKTAVHRYWKFLADDRPANPAPEDLGDAHLGLAWSHFYRKDYELAAINFQKAMPFPERRFDATRGLGYVYYHLGDYAAAAHHFRMADAQRPDQQDIVSRMDWSILRSQDEHQSAAFFKEVLKQNPLRATAYLGLGWIYYKNQQPDLGVEYLVKAVSLDPDFVLSKEFKDMLASERFGWQVYNHLGWAFYQRHKYDKALVMFNTAFSHTPRKPETVKGIGYTLLRMGQHRKAADFLHESLQLNPEVPPVTETVADDANDFSDFTVQTSARTQLARAFLKLGLYDEALRHFLIEAERHPNWPEVHDGLGWTYLKLERRIEARAEFIKALRQQPLLQSAQRGLSEVKQSVRANHTRPLASPPQASLEQPSYQ
jgi:tetratricopeptide (TPR) repeat protein